MCGIAGTLRRDGTAASAPIEEMARLIAHRGPDAEGFLVDGPVALANRRLAIIDLSEAGRQPLFNEDGSVGLVYNGELYNFHALRTELEARGHRFRSHTDSEVIVHAYEEYGPRCVERFNGMFAFAIWDRRGANGRAGALFLARDRFGVKPLYYTWIDGQLAVASEVKAFLALPGFRPALDHEALVEYLTFQNVFSDRTLFRGVRLLPAGSTLTVSVDNMGSPTVAAHQERYWSFNFADDGDRGETYYLTGVRERFEEAVRRQLMSDVPVGSYLSGGMDSGSITAVASRQIPHLHTFTGGFPTGGVAGDEALFDERAAAESMAVAMGTEHYTVVVQPQDMARLLPELVWHLEDLRVASSYHNYAVARLASKFVKVVLAGAGGDELFAGYPWRYRHALAGHGRDEFPERYAAYWSILLRDGERESFFAGPAATAARGFCAPDAVAAVVADQPADDLLNLALTFEARTYLQGLFIVEDKLSMAHSLESRVPFLDNDLVDFVAAMPSHYKLRADLGDAGGKDILRRAMRGLIPDHILRARKQGFAPPEDAWFRGPALSYLQEMLLGPRARERGLFQPLAVQQVLEQHAAGAVNQKKLLWSLLCLEQWQRIFLDGERPGA